MPRWLARLILGLGPRSPRPKWAQPVKSTPIPCRVTGVYATVQTPIGDVDTGPPTSVEVDCEVITFYFPINNASFSGRVGPRATLHLGISTFHVNVDCPPIHRGDDITIIQPLSVRTLTTAQEELHA